MITLKKPTIYYEFIDRFLITSNAYQIPTTIVFSKSDTYLKEELDEIEMLTKIYFNLKEWQRLPSWRSTLKSLC